MASSLSSATGAIHARFSTQWTTAQGYTAAQLKARVAWPGQTFTPPDTEWVRFNVLWGDSFIDTMGGSGAGKNIAVGVVSVQVFVRPGIGTGVLDGLCDDVRDIFQRVELSGADYLVRFDAPSPPKALIDDEWVGRVVDVPFTAEETI